MVLGFETCKYSRKKCPLYDPISETCNGPDSIALGYCRQRKNFERIKESKLEKETKTD